MWVGGAGLGLATPPPPRGGSLSDGLPATTPPRHAPLPTKPPPPPPHTHTPPVLPQCAWRCHKARKDVDLIRRQRAFTEKNRLKVEHRAATRIRDAFRSGLLRAQKHLEVVATEKATKEARWAPAIRIQTVARGWLARRKVRACARASGGRGL